MMRVSNRESKWRRLVEVPDGEQGDVVERRWSQPPPVDRADVKLPLEIEDEIE
jgi:hypothetical protein